MFALGIAERPMLITRILDDLHYNHHDILLRSRGTGLLESKG